jgi:hypothetical protein
MISISIPLTLRSESLNARKLINEIKIKLPNE